MQLNLVKVRGPTLMAYLNYFQMRMPHVARAHEKMQCLLHVHNVNTQASNKAFLFCFKGDFKFTCNKEELTEFAPQIYMIISLTKITILWNSIPDDIKLATSLNSFKSKLKSLFFWCLHYILVATIFCTDTMSAESDSILSDRATPR